jgi:outer membrane protein assembly factor BamA
MIPRALGSLCVIVLLGWGGPVVPAYAQQPVAGLAGRTITGVRVTSDGQEVRDPQLLSLLDFAPGQPLSMAKVRETIVHVMSLGRFLDVRVYGEEAESGVRIEVQLLPLRDINRVVFRGDLGLPEHVLRESVADRFGSTPPVGRAVDIARTLEELYARHGYLRASVQPRPLGDVEAGVGALAFDVTAGPKATIQSLAIRATPESLAPAVRATLDVGPGSPYEPEILRKRLSAYVDVWRAAGYLEARAEPSARPTEARDAVDLTVIVTRGPLVSVEFQGDPLPVRERTTLVPVAQEASADEDLLEDSERRIEDFLHRQGYRDARAPFHRSEQNGRLRIVFTVKRGPLYRVESVQLVGNLAMPDSELRPLVSLSVGEPFVQARLGADVAARPAAYRRRGFAPRARGAPGRTGRPCRGSCPGRGR